MEEILLHELRKVTAYAREYEEEFVQLVTKQNEKELDRQLRDSHRELKQLESRFAELQLY